MPLVPAKCTQCGAIVKIDNTQERGVCSHCRMEFFVEKAINNYTTNNNYVIHNAVIQNIKPEKIKAKKEPKTKIKKQPKPPIYYSRLYVRAIYVCLPLSIVGLIIGLLLSTLLTIIPYKNQSYIENEFSAKLNANNNAVYNLIQNNFVYGAEFLDINTSLIDTNGEIIGNQNDIRLLFASKLNLDETIYCYQSYGDNLWWQRYETTGTLGNLTLTIPVTKFIRTSSHIGYDIGSTIIGSNVVNSFPPLSMLYGYIHLGIDFSADFSRWETIYIFEVKDRLGGVDTNVLYQNGKVIFTESAIPDNTTYSLKDLAVVLVGSSKIIENEPTYTDIYPMGIYLPIIIFVVGGAIIGVLIYILRKHKSVIKQNKKLDTKRQSEIERLKNELKELQ